MMTIGGSAHITMIVCSVILSVLLFLIVKYASDKIQNIIITTIALIAVVGIFFLHGTRYLTTLDLVWLLKQMFQVCNFNFILLPLALFKRNELARQYLFYFSMPAALSTFVTYPSDVEGSMWYSVICLTFWINHLFIALTPILMIAAKRFKPRIEYIPKVLLCIVVYFASAFAANFIINGWSIHGGSNLSYTMSAGSIMILKPLFRLIPIPYVYLLPLLPLFALLFYLVALLFKKFNTKEAFGYEFHKRKKE